MSDTSDIYEEIIYQLYDKGKTRKQVKDELMSLGLDPTVADDVLDEYRNKIVDNLPPRGIDCSRIVAVVFGIGIFIIIIFIWVALISNGFGRTWRSIGPFILGCVGLGIGAISYGLWGD